MRNKKARIKVTWVANGEPCEMTCGSWEDVKKFGRGIDIWVFRRAVGELFKPARWEHVASK